MSNEIYFGAETENKHFDVGIVGWWYNDNYGGTLTYYALNRLVQSMGYSVLMIERPSSDPNYKPNYSTIPRRFAKKYYNISKNYHPNKMGILNGICDTFISGSDQLFSSYLWKYSGPSYYLDFTAPDKNIISYASSFGNSFDGSIKYRMMISYYLRRFNALSVREDYAVDIVRDNFGLEAKKVLDPVFVCDAAEYHKIADNSAIKLNEKYFVNFILDPDENKRNAILYAKEKLNLPFVNLIHALNFEENTKKLNLDNIKAKADVEDFLNYYRNAEFIITDSFHGTCFAIIFKKPFISIANKRRGTGRFISLLNELGLQNRMVNDASEILDRPELLEKIDYTETEKKLSVLRDDSYNWLKSALAKPVSRAKNDFQIMENRQNILSNRVSKLSEMLNELQIKTNAFEKPVSGNNTQPTADLNSKKPVKSNVVNVLDMSRCTGCGACENICPVDAITMTENKEGFLNPVLNNEKCVNCGLCSKKCIALNPEYKNVSEPKCFAMMADDDTRFISSSGGMFTVAAEYLLDKGGYVCGAAYTDNFEVEHIIISDKSQLSLLRGSKYMQSHTRHIYKDVKSLLEDGKLVLFTGMPCQVAGLYAFLGKDYDNLYTIDILCHGITSSKVFEKYHKDVLNGKPLSRLEFKAKEPWGWHAGVNAYFTDGTTYSKPLESDMYFIAYLHSISKNSTCGTCSVNRLPRQGDLTIGDFWGIPQTDPEMYDKKGTSVVLVNNEKAQKFFDILKPRMKAVKEEPLELAIKRNLIIKQPFRLHKNRNEFFKYFDELDFGSLTNGCFYNDLYQYQYMSMCEKVPAELHEMYLIAKVAVEKSKGRKIVTWIRSKIFEKVLRDYFSETVEFYVAKSPSSINNKTVFPVEKLKGKANLYYVVALDPDYNDAFIKELKNYGYIEVEDFVFRKHKPIVLENYDCSKGRYSDIYGNTIDGWDSVIKRVVFRDRNNHIIIGKETKGENLEFDLTGNSTIHIGSQCRFSAINRFQIKGLNGFSNVRIMDNCRFTDSLFRLYNNIHISSILINPYCTFESDLELHANSGKKIIIGKDCMFSHDIDLWAGDGHTIFDVSTSENINSDYEKLSAHRNHIVIGEHVWISKGAFVMHGTDIGNGSIVGAKSVVKGQYPNNCSLAGNPAKILRENVAWSREMVATDMKRQCGSEEYVRLTSHLKPSISGLKVLVIGGTRFMGVRLVNRLIELGNDVTILTRGNKKDNFGMFVRRLKLDVNDCDECRKVLSEKSYDVIFDNISCGSVGVENVLSNVEFKKYIQLSSIAVYPQRHLDMVESVFEPSDFPITNEVVKLDYSSPKYGYGKKLAEAFAYQSSKGNRIISVRIPYVAPTDRLYYYCSHIIKGMPMNISDTSNGFAFVRDTEVGKFLPWIAAQDFNGSINLASTGFVTTKMILDYIADKTGKTAVIDTEKGDVSPFREKTFSLNMDKAKQLGYTASNINDWFWRLMDEYIERALRENK